MLYTLKTNGKKYAYDSASGAVLPLNALQMKMLGAIVPPVEPTSLTALRYELAKYDSGEVSETFDEIYELSQKGVLYAEDGGTVRLMASGEYACDSDELALELLRLAFDGKASVKFETVDGDFSEVAKKAAEQTGTTID